MELVPVIILKYMLISMGVAFVMGAILALILVSVRNYFEKEAR